MKHPETQDRDRYWRSLNDGKVVVFFLLPSRMVEEFPGIVRQAFSLGYGYMRVGQPGWDAKGFEHVKEGAKARLGKP